MENIISVKNLTKEFEQGRIQALRGVSFSVRRGEYLAIIGPSGSGKSTLLNMISGMDKPTAGTAVVAGVEVSNGKRLDMFRREKIGFVFQLHNLINSLSALENVLVPMYGIAKPKKEKIKRARELLALVGLQDRENYPPSKMSGGERHRVAIARALANTPEIILADEPTGDVDTKNGNRIMDLLERINKEHGTTLINVTHNLAHARRAPRIIEIVDGKNREVTNNFDPNLC